MSPPKSDESFFSTASFVDCICGIAFSFTFVISLTFQLFSGSDDATVRVWNLNSETERKSKKCLAVLEKHFSTVTSLAVSDNGWTLLSAGRDKACFKSCLVLYL